MGLSASQARFLQLTARRNDIEYQAQQITQERLSLAQQLKQVSNEYNDAMSNKKLVFSYTDSTVHQVDVSYVNYKNCMNQQREGLTTSQQQIFLVSTSGKIVVNSIADMDEMIEKNTEYIKVSDADSSVDVSDYSVVNKKGENDKEVIQYYAKPKFTESDFVIMTKDESAKEEMLNKKAKEIPDTDTTKTARLNSLSNKIMTGMNLNDVGEFQKAIREGVFSFATFGSNEDTKNILIPQDWVTAANGAFTEKLDESDDAVAEAKYDKESKRLELYDKKMQMAMEELETEREAINTEIDTIKDIVDTNIEKSFNTFS